MRLRRLYLGGRGLRYSPHRVGREGTSGLCQSLSFRKTTCFSIPVLAIGPQRDLRSPETRAVGDGCGAGGVGSGGGLGAAEDAGGDNIFPLTSCSAACSLAMFWTICSCLAASCSKLRRTPARSPAMGSSSRTTSGEVSAAPDAGLRVTGADSGNAAPCASRARRR